MTNTRLPSAGMESGGAYNRHATLQAIGRAEPLRLFESAALHAQLEASQSSLSITAHLRGKIRSRRCARESMRSAPGRVPIARSSSTTKICR